MVSWVFLIATILALGIVALRWPRWAVVMLGISVGLEFVSQFYPQQGDVEVGISLLSLARLASVAVIVAGLCKFILQVRQRNAPSALSRLKLIIVSPLMAVILALWLYGVIGVVYSEYVSATLLELVRWGMLIAVAVSAAYVLEKKDIPYVFNTVHIMGLILAPLAFAEKIFGDFLWKEDLITEVSVRSHATFIDANIFARYLVLAIAANLVLQKISTSRRQRMFYGISLIVLLAELVLTESRGGVLTLAAVLVLVLVFLPRRKITAFLLSGITAGGILLVFLLPNLLRRVMEIEDVFSGDAQRRYLIEVALAIFGDHPIFGTGLGTFQWVFVNKYPQYKTFWEGVERSHTTVLTIAAEQGIIGLLFLAALFAVLLYMIYSLYKKYSARVHSTCKDNSYILGVGCFLWVAAVFVSSQAEGRFFEDPILWLALAMLMVLRRESMLA